MLLYGKPIAEKIKDNLKSQIPLLFGKMQKYVAILFFWENSSSSTYVHYKQKYAEEIWIQTFVFWQEKEQDISLFPELKNRIQKKYSEVNQIFELISFLNEDEKCIGIMIQLPLPDSFSEYKLNLLQSIREDKDIDWLGGSLIGKGFCDMIDFSPATPKAVFTLLDSYQLGDLKGKRVAIIGQSIIVGKPLALEAIKRWAIIQCFDISSTPEELQEGCKNAEYLFCGTWVIDLINEKHINNNGNQILIDIWYWLWISKRQGKTHYSSSLRCRTSNYCKPLW